MRLDKICECKKVEEVDKRDIEVKQLKKEIDSFVQSCYGI